MVSVIFYYVYNCILLLSFSAIVDCVGELNLDSLRKIKL